MARTDYYTGTQKKQEIYSDFLTDLNPHPEAKDIVRFTNENAVKKSIRNIILTNRFERPFQPNLGSSINRLMFEPITASTAQTMTNMITEAITNHEPRCNLISVTVVPLEDQHAMNVEIVFMVINIQNPVTLNITLYKVR